MNEPYTIKRSSQKCSKTDRVLEPGDIYYSVLIETSEGIERIEISQEAWEGEPEDTLGWWKCKVPKLDSGKVYWAPAEVIVDYFDRLMKSDQGEDARYVMALLLLRKRLARQVDSVLEENDDDYIEIYINRLDQNYKMKVVELTAEQVKQIESTFSQHLFTDRPLSSVD